MSVGALTSLDIRLALQGEHDAFYAATAYATLLALTDAAIEVGEMARSELKRDTRAAGLGVIERTWRLQMFPRGAEQRHRRKDNAPLTNPPTDWRDLETRKGLSRNPAAFIYSKAPHIVESFEKGVTIGGGPSAPIAIPIPGSPADELKNPRGPDTKVDAAIAKFGELDVVPGSAGRPGMLVLSLGRFSKTGRLSATTLTKRGKIRKGTVSVPLFWLVSNAHLRKRLNLARVRYQAERRSAARLRHHLDKHMGSSAIQALLS